MTPDATLYFAYGAGAVSAAMGMLGILAPNTALKLVGLDLRPGAPEALSEVRATFGGLFLAMSLLAIISSDIMAFAAVGAGWLGAGILRISSIIVDRLSTGKNWGAAVFESALGLGLLAPLLAASLR